MISTFLLYVILRLSIYLSIYLSIIIYKCVRVCVWPAKIIIANKINLNLQNSVPTFVKFKLIYFHLYKKIYYCFQFFVFGLLIIYKKVT